MILFVKRISVLRLCEVQALLEALHRQTRSSRANVPVPGLEADHVKNTTLLETLMEYCMLITYSATVLAYIEQC